MRALIIVDVQNDFLPGGALAVPDGDQVIPVINRLTALSEIYDVVVATQDWHPSDHGSFAAHQEGEIGDVIDLDGLPQILWPVHCVQGTRGAEFAAALDCRPVSSVFTKGSNPQIDSYSGFFDNGHRESTGLDAHLQQLGVDEVDVVGLATDYCVKFTALDAVSLGFRTRLIRDACRGVELQVGDVAAAIAEMEAAGVTISDSQDLFDATPKPSGAADNDAANDETLAAGRFLSLVSRGGWEFAHRHNATAVVVVVATNEGQVLIVEQQRIPAGGDVLELPAGLAGDEGDSTESTLLAAKRELLEETGYVAAKWQMLRECYSSPGLTDESLTYFWAHDLEKRGEGGGVGDENIICHWAPIDDIERWLDKRQRQGKRVSNLIPAGIQMMTSRELR